MSVLSRRSEEIVQTSGEPLASDHCQLEVFESQADEQILLVGLGKERVLEPQIAEIEEAGGRVHGVVPGSLALFHAYRQSSNYSAATYVPTPLFLSETGWGDSTLFPFSAQAIPTSWHGFRPPIPEPI